MGVQLQADKGVRASGWQRLAPTHSWSYVEPECREVSTAESGTGKSCRGSCTACLPATHLFPPEGYSNWLSCTVVAKKHCGGILKIEQPGPMSTRRDLVVGHQCHARPRETPSPGATRSPYPAVPPDVHPHGLFHCTTATGPPTTLGCKQACSGPTRGWGPPPHILGW